MCGAEAKSLKTVIVAGSNMDVCNSCSSMGTVKGDKVEQSFSFRKGKRKEENLEVTSDYAKIIRTGINKRHLSVQQVARAVNIKESSLSNYLKGQIKPIITNARKLESFLGIKLVFEVEASNVSVDDFKVSADDDSSLTLGEMILKKMHK